MNYLITGENIYKRREALKKITAATQLAPERYDGQELTENQLADCIAGGTLFSAQRLVIINELSVNKQLWDKMAEWLNRISQDTTLVLIEPKPDRRTRAYKTLSKAFTLVVAEHWTDRQLGEAMRWLADLAKQNDVKLTPDQLQQIISRSMMPGDRPGAYIIDQQVLANSMETLSLLDKVGDDSIDAVLPASNLDNVFELLDAALSGNKSRINELMANLHATADPYMTLGFVMSQWAQLVALRVSGEQPDILAARIGVSSFVIKKLQKHANAMAYPRLKELTELLARLDVQSKTTGADPWSLLARFVGELAK